MGTVSSMISHIMYTSEKLIACFTCTMLITCIVATFVLILGLGIGIGYNYCFVDMRTRHKYVPSGYRHPGGPRIPYARYNRYYPRAREDSYRDNSLPSFKALPEETALPGTTITHLETTIKTPETTTGSSLNSTNTSAAMTTNALDTSTSTSTEVTDTGRYNNIIDLKSKAVEVVRGPPPVVINGPDLIALLSRMRSENMNFTLQLVTN